MSVNLEQAPGTGGGVTEPPLHPCKPKDASSATAVPTPSFSSSRRVKLCIGPKSWMPSTKQRWDRLPSPACLDYRKLAHRHSGPPWDSGSLRRQPARIYISESLACRYGLNSEVHFSINRTQLFFPQGTHRLNRCGERFLGRVLPRTEILPRISICAPPN